VILFEIKLTTAQIATLRDFAELTDAYEEAGLKPWEKPKEGTQAERAHSNIFCGVESRHFIASARVLEREGLIKHNTKPEHHWFITEKGRCLLRVVEIDVAEFHARIKQKRLALKTKAA